MRTPRPEARAEGSPPPQEVVNQQIREHIETMNKRLLAITGEVDAPVRKMSADRISALERQRAIIQDKLRFITERNHDSFQSYEQQRTTLLEEVDRLVSYAEYQAAQERDNEKRGYQWPDIEPERIEKTDKEIKITAPKEALMQFTYVSRSPEIARVLGVMNFDANTYGMTMNGRFRVERGTNSKGEHCFVLIPDAAFDGTFTFYIQGKRTTVDWMNAQSARNQHIQQLRDEVRAEREKRIGFRAELTSLITQLSEAKKNLGEVTKIESIQASISQLNLKITESNQTIDALAMELDRLMRQ